MSLDYRPPELVGWHGPGGADERDRVLRAVRAGVRRGMALVAARSTDASGGLATAGRDGATGFDPASGLYRLPSYQGDGELVALPVNAPGAPPVGYLPVDKHQISVSPQLARWQLRAIALKEGVKAAREIPRGLHFRRARLGYAPDPSAPALPPELRAQADTYTDIIAALNAELAEWDRFARVFEQAARKKVGQMLDFSEKRVSAERDRYGVTSTEEWVHTEWGPARGPDSHSLADNPATTAMARAAHQLLDALTPLQKAVAELEAIDVPEVRGTWEFDIGLRPTPPDPAKLAAAREEVRRTQERYLRLLDEVTKEGTGFPVLSSFAEYERLHTFYLKGVRQKLETVGRGVPGGERTAALVAGDVLGKLANIAEVRAALKNPSRPLNIWAADNVVALTKIEMGIARDSLEDKIINQRVADDASDRRLRDLLIGAFAFALALLAAPLTGGGSLALAAGAVAGAGSLALSAGLAFEHLQEYQLEKAASGTDFTKARAISTLEPSLFWLALDIVGVVLDIDLAARAFQNLARLARPAVSASGDAARPALDALEKAAAAEVPGAPQLGRTVRQAAEEQRQRTPIALHHGTDQRGYVGLGGLAPRIDVAHAPGVRQDLGRGFYLTMDEATAQAYARVRGRQRGGGLQHVLTFEVDDLKDLGRIVDIRPGGNFRPQWEAFLREPPVPGVQHTPGLGSIREFLTGLGVERRGEIFETFLARYGMTDADAIIAPLGDGVFTGITSGKEAVQVAIRSQRVADRLTGHIPGASDFTDVSRAVGLDPPGSVSAARADFDEVGRRLDALAPTADRGKAMAAAEVHVKGYSGPATLTEVSRQPKATDPVVPRSDISTPERHLFDPDQIDLPPHAGAPTENRGIPKDPAGQPLTGAEREAYLDAKRLPGETPGRHGPHPGPRAHDAEAKILERVSAQLPPDAVGTIHLKASHPVCASCVEAVNRFRGKHPRVQVVLH